MMYTLELIVMSIGIIELFQLVSFWSSCILIYVLYVCMLSIPRISISIGIYFPYIYMFVFMLVLEFQFCLNWLLLNWYQDYALF